MRILKSNPLLRLVNSYIIDASEPSNISYLWNFGSLLALCLIVQIVTGVTLAMKVFQFFVSMFYPAEYPSVGILNKHVLSSSVIPSFSCTQLKDNIKSLEDRVLHLKEDKVKSWASYSGGKANFSEWLRGFTDGEGYFLITLTSRKRLKKSGELIDYHRFNFSFILHVAIKDLNVLYNIQRFLGGIGVVNKNEKSSKYAVTSREDTNKLLELMYNSFSRLNTIKVLDFLAWYEARTLYLNFMDERDKEVPLHLDPSYSIIHEKILSIKSFMNRARTNFRLPENHVVIITNEWLLGFFEGEGCFYVNNFSVCFKLAQTSINRYVLVHIKDYLMKYGSNMVISLFDSKSNKLKQKPYTELYIGKNNQTAYILISLLINLPWLSTKVVDFVNWVIIYILVYEGKHILPEGKDIIVKLRSNMGLNSNINDPVVSKETLDLLYSENNYVETDQSGILKVRKNSKGLSSVIHRQGSYVLATNEENTSSLRFNSNAECANYFEVSKVTVGRWISKNSPVTTKKGTFRFKKLFDDEY